MVWCVCVCMATTRTFKHAECMYLSIYLVHGNKITALWFFYTVRVFCIRSIVIALFFRGLTHSVSSSSSFSCCYVSMCVLFPFKQFCFCCLWLSVVVVVVVVMVCTSYCGTFLDALMQQTRTQSNGANQRITPYNLSCNRHIQVEFDLKCLQLFDFEAKN